MELLLALDAADVLDDAIHRTDLRALRRLKMTNALGTLLGVDNVDLGALGDGTVRALRLADVAIDTFFSDLQ
jgi:hypothetical protein